MTYREIDRLLKEGLTHHQRGQLEQAGECYSQVLSEHPERADALHLFGTLMHQWGDHVSASRAMARSLAFRPNEAHVHANLSEVYRAQGESQLAYGSRTLALRLRQDLYESAQDYDLLIHPGPPIDEIVGSSRPTPATVPDEVIVQTNIANDLRHQGDRATALDHDFVALSYAPQVGELHCNLGQNLLEAGRVEEALFHCTTATRLAPYLAEAWNNLGNVFRKQGRKTEAKESYLHALRLNPDLVITVDNLAMTYFEDGWLAEAVVCFRLSLGLAPNSVEVRWNMASALKDLGRYDEAVACCEEALVIDPQSPETHVTLGSILHERGRNEEAAAHFVESIRANPNYSPAHCSLGVIFAEKGDFEAAERSIRDVLRLNVDHSRALADLATIHRGKLPDADLAHIERLIGDPNIVATNRADLHFAMAHVLDARGDHNRAGEHLRQANAIKLEIAAQAGRAYFPEEHDQFIDELIDAFSPEFFERVQGFGSMTERPIFIVGFPRSGTTLTEQILASHSQVHGAGELLLTHRNFEKLPAIIGSSLPLAQSVGLLDQQAVLSLARDHLAGLDEINRDASRVVDKMPENYLYLGLIATLFPQARLIHCRRDLRDVAVSCWSTNFRKFRWANDLRHLSTRIATYLRISNHWNRNLPAPVLEVDYEETVTDLEGVARRLLDWCGLDWEPACLAFHKTRNVVQTASLKQVREPIYRRSVERWRKYESTLGPFFDELEQIRILMEDRESPGRCFSSPSTIPLHA